MSNHRRRLKRAVICGPSGLDMPLDDLFDMQDEINALRANALNTELVAAEARRAERAPKPDSMDLYFQGLAWPGQGGFETRHYRASAQLDRSAHLLDPDNVDAHDRTGKRGRARGGGIPCDRSHGSVSLRPKLA